MPMKRVVAPQIDFSVLRRELRLPDEFPAAVLAEAGESARDTPLPEADLTEVPFLTVDPAGSQDLDQAMHLSRRDGGGYRIRYAIADVFAYVRPGSLVEAESWVRGQTIYLPDGRVPLHPPVLSEGAVSLLPDVVRAAVVWTIDLDAVGETVGVALGRARIRSRAKLDYAGVQQQIDAGTAPDELLLLPEIGTILAERAADRGAVNLPLPEQDVERDGDGWRLVLRASLPIEEHNAQISLLTGMAAAQIMLAGGIGLLRTMPAPKPEAVATLRAAAESLDVPWPPGALVGAVVSSVDPASPRGAAFLDQAADLLRGAAYTAFGTTSEPSSPAVPPKSATPASAAPASAAPASAAPASAAPEISASAAPNAVSIAPESPVSTNADAGNAAPGNAGPESARPESARPESARPESARPGDTGPGRSPFEGAGPGSGGGLPAEVGHGGVGAPYAHVTAPLRRLADRYATEACLALFEGRPVPDDVREALGRLPKTMATTDRVAGAADRGAIDLAEAVVLEHRVGETFEVAVLDRDEGNSKRPPGGTVALDDPAVRAKCAGDLPLGRRIPARLTAADPSTRTVRFERL